MNISFEELQVMAIFNTGTREGTIAAIQKIRSDLEPEETELLELVDAVTKKLLSMTDGEFNALDILPAFDE